MTRSVSRWLFVLTLMVARAAWADAPNDTTDKAISALRDGEKKAATLATQRQQLATRYAEELDAIDRLKKQRASWNRDRELRGDLSDSAETANQLATLARQLVAAQDAIVAERRAVVAAIDAEQATGARGAQLAQLRTQLAPARTAPKKIVLPDADVDPLADPEDLDRQAAALRETEAELASQVHQLEGQAKDLDKVAMLRKQHERAGVLANRDDDQSSHATPRTGDRTTDGAAAPTDTVAGGGGEHGTTVPSSLQTPTGGGYESEALVVLVNVVDATTIDALTRAQRSGDPSTRAEAARKTRDAVKARMDSLAKKRAMIEARAKSLRH
jgi:hypothetical protein